MHEFLLKPNDIITWAPTAIDKIQKTITSCTNLDQLKVAKTMVDNFIMVLAINTPEDSDTTHVISRQLWLTYKLKENKLAI